MTVRPDTRYSGPTWATRARWLMKAGPADYLLAASVAATSLPIVVDTSNPSVVPPP